MHHQNSFRLFINGKIRKGAIKIFIKTVFKAQENQRFSMVTKLKLCAFAFNFLYNALWAPLLLEGNGLWCSKKLGDLGE